MLESRVCFEQLEEWVREQIQFYVQELLEDEVTQLLGRRKNERRREVGAPGGYRNGYGKERRLTLSCGTIKLRRPRVRDLEERFESRVLPLFAKRTREVRDLIPELYLHGLAEGDFDLALRGLLGEEAPLSPSTVARLKQKWQGEMEAWKSRRLDDLEVVSLWADGVYIKAGLEKEKAVILVVIAALSDGTKVVVSVSSGYRESTQSWSEVLRYLKERGMNPPRLVIADGDLGSVAQRLPRSRRTEMLESSHRQLAGQDPQGSTQSGLVDVAADPLCRNTAGSRASQRTIPTLVWQERTGGSG